MAVVRETEDYSPKIEKRDFRRIYTPYLKYQDVEIKVYNLECIQPSGKQHKAGCKGISFIKTQDITPENACK